MLREWRPIIDTFRPGLLGLQALCSKFSFDFSYQVGTPHHAICGTSIVDGSLVRHQRSAEGLWVRACLFNRGWACGVGYSFESARSGDDASIG